jgi:hypothetical protein
MVAVEVNRTRPVVPGTGNASKVKESFHHLDGTLSIGEPGDRC